MLQYCVFVLDKKNNIIIINIEYLTRIINKMSLYINLSAKIHEFP